MSRRPDARRFREPTGRAPGRVGWMSACALAIAVSSAACNPGVPDRFRVTLIGIDGAAWRVIDPLLAQGELPNLASQIEAGVRAPLRSIRPLLSPAVWTTIATGMTRARHGIRKFNRRDGRLSSSTHRQVPALWTMADHFGLRSAVLGWWATYPAEPINGVIVTGRALKTRDDDVRKMVRGRIGAPAANGLVHPPEVFEHVGELISAAHESDRTETEADRVLRVMRSEDAAVVHSLVRLRGVFGPFDLELALLRGVDPVSHYFWKYYEPEAPAYTGERPSAELLRRYRDSVEGHYRYVDGLLAELGEIGTRDHVMLIVSDHGFEAGHQPHRSETLSGTHKSARAIDGIFIARGGPFLRGAQLERISILDVAPTMLHLLGLPIPDDLEGEIIAGAFDAEWLSAHPIDTIDRYPRGVGPKGARRDDRSPVDDRVQSELRSLGYIE